MSLADLLTQAVGDDPWYPADYDEIRTQNPDEIRLVALVPDLAKLAIDMAEQLGGVVAGYEDELAASVVPLHGVSVYVSEKEAALIGELLARFAALDQRATGGPAVNAIERLRSQIYAWVPGGGSDEADRDGAFAALAAVDALYQAAKRHADNTGSFNALAAAVRRIEEGQ